MVAEKGVLTAMDMALKQVHTDMTVYAFWGIFFLICFIISCYKFRKYLKEDENDFAIPISFISIIISFLSSALFLTWAYYLYANPMYYVSLNYIIR